MTSSKDLQERIAATLALPGVLPEGIPIVVWRKKDLKTDNEVTIATQRGIAVLVPAPVPTSAMQGTPFVFFDGYECRVQIVEMPEVNRDGVADLYDLIEMVALGLHWQPTSEEAPLAGILAHPLYLAARPVEVAEGVVAVPGFEHNGQAIRGADVIFNAVLQINQLTD